jgi:hypothetical protein
MDVKGRKGEAPITMDEDEEQKGQFLESDCLYPHWCFAYANAFSTGLRSRLMISSLVASFILVFRISILEV